MSNLLDIKVLWNFLILIFFTWTLEARSLEKAKTRVLSHDSLILAPGSGHKAREPRGPVLPNDVFKADLLADSPVAADQQKETPRLADHTGSSSWEQLARKDARRQIIRRSKFGEFEESQTLQKKQIKTKSDKKTSSTEGNRKKQDSLPGWLLVVIGSATAGASVVLCTKLADRLCKPSRECVPTEAEKLAEELVAARDRATELEKALQAAAQAEASAVGAPESGSGEVEEPQQGKEELVGEMLARSKELEEQIAQGATDAIGQASAVIARADHVQKAFQTGVDDLRSRVETLATKEAKDLSVKLQEAMGQEVIAPPDWLLKLNEPSDGSKTDVVGSVSLMLAAVVAPTRIRMLGGGCDFQIFFNGLLLAIGAGVTFSDRHAPCADKFVWIWMDGMMVISFFAVVSNALLKSSAKAAQDVLRIEEAKFQAKHKFTGNAVWDTFLAIEDSTGFYLRALFMYDDIVSRKFFHLSQGSGLAYLLWGGVGLYITIADVVEDSEHCKAKALLFFMHVFSFFYVFLLSFLILLQLIWVTQCLATTRFSSQIIQIAKSIDDSNPGQLPICLTFTRSFVLSTSHMYKALSEQIGKDIGELENQAAEIETKLAALRQQAQEAEAAKLEAEGSEEVLIQKYEDQVKEVLSAARPVVAIASTQVPADFGEGEVARASKRASVRASLLATSSAAGAADGGSSSGDPAAANSSSGDPAASSSWSSWAANLSDPDALAAAASSAGLPASLAEATAAADAASSTLAASAATAGLPASLAEASAAADAASATLATSAASAGLPASLAEASAATDAASASLAASAASAGLPASTAAGPTFNGQDAENDVDPNESF
eukprot:TRINITY_DN1735_c0_g1_i1.p1 TRINITY_DN1735_c0_g1~~TRINITY_DN1735_c0_g1_i1.p1  ORF type:complete len:838 (-),score=192.84 TRINITY_DN1735_c0_g1_i1:218-2731(-)